MVLSEQFFARVFRNLAKLVVDVSNAALRVGDGDDGVRIERRFVLGEQPRITIAGGVPAGGAGLQRLHPIDQLVTGRLRKITHRELRVPIKLNLSNYADVSWHRYSVGDCPMTFLNTRLKWVSDWKPTSYAISLTRRFGLSSRFFAFSMRTRDT